MEDPCPGLFAPDPRLTAYEAGYLRALLEDLEEAAACEGRECPTLSRIAGKVHRVDAGVNDGLEPYDGLHEGCGHGC